MLVPTRGAMRGGEPLRPSRTWWERLGYLGRDECPSGDISSSGTGLTRREQAAVQRCDFLTQYIAASCHTISLSHMHDFAMWCHLP